MSNTLYGVWAIRSGGSIFGHAEAWCKDHGREIEFDSKDEARKYAAKLNAEATMNCRYQVREKRHEPGAIKYPLERTPDGKIPAPGRPVHLPENYLLNAELKEEAQTGNYNMLDGRMDNISPENDPAKASVLDKLKAGSQPDDREPPTHSHGTKERDI